jgi:hypothetical protein
MAIILLQFKGKRKSPHEAYRLRTGQRIYYMNYTKGTLIKWIESHRSYEANGDILVGLEPIYRCGIIMEISKQDPRYIAVASCSDGRWHVVNVHHDSIEVLSEAANG